MDQFYSHEDKRPISYTKLTTLSFNKPLQTSASHTTPPLAPHRHPPPHAASHSQPQSHCSVEKARWFKRYLKFLYKRYNKPRSMFHLIAITITIDFQNHSASRSYLKPRTLLRCTSSTFKTCVERVVMANVRIAFART